MNYSQDLLNQIKELAEALTPITEIGVLLELNERELRDDINTIDNPARKAYYTGFAKTALEVRKRNIELSKAGSPSADEAVRGYINKLMRDL